MMAKHSENNQSVILGMPAVLFFILAAIVLASAYLKLLPDTLLGGLALCAAVGYLLKFVVEHIPVLQKTIGLASVSFICALLVYWKLIPEESVGIVKNVISGTDFLGFFVCALLCGSVIGMDRKILIKAGARYFIPVIGGIVFAYGLGALAGICLGYDWREVLLYIAGPIMGGGNGAGAVPMSRIYAAASGLGAEDMYSKLLPAITLGNWIAIFSAIGLKCLGDRIPSLTGNGVLVQGVSAGEEKKENHFVLQLTDLGTGFFVSSAFFIFGILVSKLMPSVHSYAFTIIAVAAVKIMGILLERVEFCVVKWYQFVSGNFMVVIMAGVGIGMFNLASLFAVLSIQFVLLCVVIVLGAILGAGLLGMVVKFFFVESAITAGLCMCNAGGNGDVMVLTAADRMELMCFAQISSRLGGAIILIIQSILASALL